MHVMKKKEKNAREQAEEDEKERQFERLKQETLRNKIVRKRTSYRDSVKAAKKLTMSPSKPIALSSENNDLEDPLQETLEGYQEMVNQAIIDESELELMKKLQAKIMK
jgi:hypothetical protein